MAEATGVHGRGAAGYPGADADRLEPLAMGTTLTLALALFAAIVVLCIVGAALAPFALVAWIVERLVGRTRRVGVARAAGTLGRWVEIVNTSFEPMFYGEVVRSTAATATGRSPLTMALRGVLVPQAFSPQLTSDLAQKYPASKDAQGHFLVLALTDPGNDLIVTKLADDGKIKELNERLASLTVASAPRITINSAEIALIDAAATAAFDEDWGRQGARER
jgi:hypothetical protein